MSLFAVEVHSGRSSVRVNGVHIDASRIALDVIPGEPAVLTVWTCGSGDVTGEGIVHVVREPTPAEVDEAAIAAVAAISPAALEARCARVLRASARRDVYAVVLQQIAEMARA
jgi:hypothetical protein